MSDSMKLKIIEAITKEVYENNIDINIFCERILSIIEEK